MPSFGGSKAYLSTPHGDDRASIDTCIVQSSAWRTREPTCAVSDCMLRPAIALPSRSISESVCVLQRTKCMNPILCYLTTRATTALRSRLHVDREGGELGMRVTGVLLAVMVLTLNACA